MANIKTGPSRTGLQAIYVPAVCILIFFLAYFSQWLFARSPELAPGPLTRRESITFNLLIACVWYTYYKAITVDPGRYIFPKSSSPKTTPAAATNQRWCKKCNAPKPPRAHHCRHCARCIPKMDHHCPWTANCVSLQTFPYFLRFLVYTNLALWTLAYHIYTRLSQIWSDRHLPAYLGPSLSQLISLTILSLFCTGTCIALGVLLFTTLRSWALNATMIEDWESERHEAVLSRLQSSSSSSSSSSGDGDDAEKNYWGADGSAGVLAARLSRIEFPYDLGLWSNLVQAMGTRNFLAWFSPFAGGPVIDNTSLQKGTGWEYEENGFNDLPGMWPPPDPDKLRRAQSGWPGAAARVAAASSSAAAREGYEVVYRSPEDEKAAFAARQRADALRRLRLKQSQQNQHAQEDNLLAELEEEFHRDFEGGEEVEGGPVWTNSEGDRLWDYGVDEEVERDDAFPSPSRAYVSGGPEDDDDDVPIAELIRRRRVLTKEEDG
ncbi:Palmitoyltransferase PFA4 [Echria macrotheca]|uniref:Palmitoyltransferase PFA4 n=1 Tax=Echria macrotheca TaxID=438768 RepID=A0AAJ0BEF2_9PEZI|nr:Palmitoyltransferase PFA4 [Echria macrotheca]